ncbi:MAG: FHA domain-containing protein [Atopobiaceae bacterium]|nr:FHA domain-containing protein [Atopobiaceae bacterium]
MGDVTRVAGSVSSSIFRILHVGGGGTLNSDDLSSLMYDEYEWAMQKGEVPNLWEVTLNTQDADALGGNQEVAETCKAIIEEIVQEDGWSMDTNVLVVVDQPDPAHAKDARKGLVKASVVSKEDLRDRAIQARLLGKGSAGEAGGAHFDRPLPVSDGCELVVRCKWNGERVQAQGKCLNLGAAKSNDVVVDTCYVSHFHGQFVQSDESPSGWIYVDDSKNGTTINGVSVEGSAPVFTGDEMCLSGVATLVVDKAQGN